MEAILEKYAKFANTIHYKIFEDIDLLDVSCSRDCVEITGNLLGFAINITFGNEGRLAYRLNNQTMYFGHESQVINLRTCAKAIFSCIEQGIFREGFTNFYFDFNGNSLAKMFTFKDGVATYYKLPSRNWEILGILGNNNATDIKCNPEDIIILSCSNYDNIGIFPNVKYLISRGNYTGPIKHYKVNNIFDAYDMMFKLLKRHHHQETKSAKKVN